jgi:hypothetical protein
MKATGHSSFSNNTFTGRRWNSVQSVTKFQQEPGGALKDGDPVYNQKE